MNFGFGFGYDTKIFIPEPLINLTNPANNTQLDETIFNTEEGFIEFSYDISAKRTSTANTVIFSVDDGTTNNRLFMWHPSSGNGGTTGRIQILSRDATGTNNIDHITANTNFEFTKFNWVIRYGSFGIEFYLNGVKIISSPDAKWVTNAQRWYIGALAGSFTFAGTFTRFKYYDRPLSEAAAYAATRDNVAIVNGITKDNDKRIVLGSGQSNIIGYNEGEATYTNIASMEKLGIDGVLASYADPLVATSGGLYVETLANVTGFNVGSLGYTINNLISNTTSDWIAAIAAKAGSSITDWSNVSTGNSGTAILSRISDLRWAMLNHIQLCKQYSDYIYFNWWHGETPAFDGATKQAYEDFFKIIREGIMGVYPQTLIVVNTLHQWSAGIGGGFEESDWNNIIQAQRNITDTYTNCYLNDISDLDFGELHGSISDMETVGLRTSKVIETIF